MSIKQLWEADSNGNPHLYFDSEPSDGDVSDACRRLGIRYENHHHYFAMGLKMAAVKSFPPLPYVKPPEQGR